MTRWSGEKYGDAKGSWWGVGDLERLYRTCKTRRRQMKERTYSNVLDKEIGDKRSKGLKRWVRVHRDN